MSENATAKISKLKIALITAASVVVVGGAAVGAVLLLNNGGEAPEDEEPAHTIGFENNGVIVMEDDDIDSILEGMRQEAADGMMDLSYKNIAVSYDGENFACNFGNPASNKYYMYFNIFTDATLEEQMLLTGLVEPGMQLESFKSEIKLDPGQYEAVLAFTQVKDDQSTICGQAMVVLNLVVYDGKPEFEEVDDENSEE